jgi:hypothetical protein
MINEDSILVTITASKEVDGADEGSAAAASPGKRHKFTMYTVSVRNRVSGGKCVVRRRYSDFFNLRKELMGLVSWGHCAFCDEYLRQIAEYPFPRRRLLRSSRSAVVKERMDSLGLFLRHILLCILGRSFEDCHQASENIENCVLRSFLQMDETESLFPTIASKQRPIEIIQAMEERRQQQIKAAGQRTKSLVYSALAAERLDSAQQPQSRSDLGPDRCHLCLQKWVNCYCNSEQDSIYPVGVGAAMAAHELAAELPPRQNFGQYRTNQRDSNLSVDSDCSRCSRCHHGWDKCYCCQQMSPATSSVYTET